MDKLAIGLWGSFFGVVAAILIGSGLAYLRSLRRVAVNAALSAAASAVYVTVFLIGFPATDEATQNRLLALISLAVSATLTYLLFAVLGFMRSAEVRQRALLLLCLAMMVALLLGWLLPATLFFMACTVAAGLLGLLALGASVKRAVNADPLAWVVVFAICCMLVAMVGLDAIALDRAEADWALHALSAFAATLYMGSMAAVMWSRYAHLVELHKLMAYGPSYDPVTRMRSHIETGHMVGAVFKSFRASPKPLGVVAMTIANLYALEQLYGAHAVNHALFICAARLRRSVPTNVEMGRLGKEGFVLLMRNCSESADLIQLARTVQTHLRRPVSLNTSGDLETAGTLWAAEIGAGVLLVSNP